MSENIKNMIGESLDFVINKKYQVKIYDLITEKLDEHQWSLQEITLYLMGTGIKTKRIHLYNTIDIENFSLQPQKGDK